MKVLALIWQISVIYLIAHYLFFYLRLILYRPLSPKNNDKEGVSLIICAFNEAVNLRKNLPEVLNQEYPLFEVLVVDDNSNDNSRDLIEELQKEHPHLRYVFHRKDPGYRGKKKALAYGLSQAKYRKVLLTDADCTPAGRQWLKNMTMPLQYKDIVLGYGALKRERGWLNKLQRWETLQTAVQYFSLACAGVPYMGVGRNLAYFTKVFEDSDRFSSHLHLPSGDDDLFVGSVANAGNTAIQMDPSSFTYSRGVKSFREWWRQKRRHLSTSSYYHFFPKVLLGIYGIAQLSFYVFLPVILLFYHTRYMLLILLVKLLIQYGIMFSLARKLKCPEILWLMPVWECMTVVSQVLIHLQNRWSGNMKNWK